MIIAINYFRMKKLCKENRVIFFVVFLSGFEGKASNVFIFNCVSLDPWHWMPGSANGKAAVVGDTSE